jgi:hypothetical protein
MLYEPFYDWIEYPTTETGLSEWNPAHVGFRARILVNPSGSQVRAETQRYIASNGIDLQAQEEYLKYIAPRIVEWNLQVRDEAGTPVDIPPPVDNWEMLGELPFDLQMWLRSTVHWAHQKKVLMALTGTLSPEPVTTTDSTQPIPIRQSS